MSRFRPDEPSADASSGRKRLICGEYRARQGAARGAARGDRRAAPSPYGVMRSMPSGESAWWIARMLAPSTAAFGPAVDCTMVSLLVASGIERV